MFTCGRILPVLLPCILLSSIPALGAVSTTPDKTQILSAASGLQLPFVANRGQVKDPAVAFTADTFACRVAVTRGGEIVYHPSGPAGGVAAMKISERLVGARIKVEGRDRQKTKISYFPGRDRSAWRTNIPSYGRVTLGYTTPNIRIDLKAHGDNVEKLIHLKHGGDPQKVRIAVDGIDTLAVGPDGELVLTTASGGMRFSKPVAFQEMGGRRRPVPVGYTIDGNTYGFVVGAYDPGRELVIDPLVKVFAAQDIDTTYNAFMDVVSDSDGNV